MSGPRTSPVIPKKYSPPIVPMTLSATGRFDCFDMMYGRSRLSIVAMNNAPYKSRNIPAKVCPDNKRNRPTGSQTSHEPRTGIIETRQAMNVRISAFGTPSINSPIPRVSPWIIPIRTCPKIIALVIPLNSFRNFSSVFLENGESVDMYFFSSSPSLIAK